MSHDLNPYAPPKHDGHAATSADPALEALRREHINAETNVKTIGFLLYLGTLSSIVGGINSMALDPFGALVSIVLGGAMGFGGYWLQRLDRRGRTTYTVVTGLGFAHTLLAGTLSTVPPALVAWTFIWPLILLAILWGQKASTVMTPHYRDVVIPATPHVKRRTSPLVIVMGLLVLGVIIAGAVMAL